MSENSSNNAAATNNEGSLPAEARETLDGLLEQMSRSPEDGNDSGSPQEGAEETEAEGEAGESHEVDGGNAQDADGREDEPGDDGEDQEWLDGNADGEGEEDGDEQERQSSRNFRGRWDHLSAEERRVVELTTKRGLSLDEAYRAVYGEGSRGGEAQEDDEGQEEGSSEAAGSLAAADEAVAKAQRELEELEAQLDDGDDPFDGDPAQRRKVQRELREKTVTLAELKAEQKLLKRELELEERQRQEQTASKFEAGYQDSVTEAERLYPDLAADGTPLREAVEEEIQYLAATKSPLLNQPDFPLVVARRMARSLGIKAAGAAGQSTAGASKPQGGAPAAVKNSASKPGSRGIRPLPAGGSPVEPPSFEQRAAGATTSAEMLDLMREYGTPLAELAKR